MLNTFVQIKEQHRGDLMTAGPKSQLLAGIVVDTIPGPVSILTITLYWCNHTASYRMRHFILDIEYMFSQTSLFFCFCSPLF